MRQAKGTFCLEEDTLRRLQEFSRRTGIPQSAIVDKIVSTGLVHLENNWKSADDVLDAGFAQELPDVAGKGKRL